MMDDKIFLKVVKILEIETGAKKEQLLHDKHEEYVDYRVLLVQSLHKLGYNDQSISDRFGITRQGVSWLRNQFPYRLRNRFTLSSHWKAIEKELHSIASDLF